MTHTDRLLRPASNTQAQLQPIPTRFDSDRRTDFWLCLWLRHIVVADALKSHIDDLQVWASASPALRHALCSACLQLQRQADDSADTLTEAGGLLYAFEGTTRPAHAIAIAGGAL